ncbi:hypothetical protein ABZ490_40155 [Streptomyces sp. NPDC005811]|uniref:hypothetical protein n=1 Tax=Streptomyces sp. NPDC005811 TaxID=3154565 RepID=UPI0033EC5CA5
MSTFPHQVYTRLKATGRDSVHPLTAQLHDVRQRFVTEVSEAGRRMAAETLAAQQADRDRMITGHETPMVVLLVVRSK